VNVCELIVVSGESPKIRPVIFWSMIPCSLVRTERYVSKPAAFISLPLFCIECEWRRCKHLVLSKCWNPINRRTRRLFPQDGSPRPCFTLLCSNTTYQFTSLLNLRFLVFSLIPLAVFTIFFPPNAPTCPCGLRGFPSWVWQKCNRLPRLGRPWGAVTLSRWCEWWYRRM